MISSTAVTRYFTFCVINFSIIIYFLTSSLASSIFFSKYDLFVSYLVFKINPVASILTFATNLSYIVLLTISLFTTLLSLLKSTGTVLSTSVSGFRLAKSNFADNLDVSTPQSSLTLIFPPKDSNCLRKY